jgi:hypothetical protein
MCSRFRTAHHVQCVGNAAGEYALCGIDGNSKGFWNLMEVYS